LYVLICLDISLPIDPAAPVTRIVFPLTSLLIIGLSIDIGFLSNKSSILTCLI